MTLARAFAALLVSVAISGALAFALSAAADEPETPASATAVVWDERPDDLGELGEEARSVVEARVAEVAQGPPLGAGEEHAGIPTQRISFEVLSTLDGPDPGPVLRLMKAGSVEQYLANDPPYSVGERYVLFVEPWSLDPGTYVLAAPDGRVRLNAQDEAHLFIPGSVKTELEGESLAEIEAQVSE
jgi:hypothetical protein